MFAAALATDLVELQSCTYCSMMVAEPKFSVSNKAMFVPAHFCDIGCAVNYRNEACCGAEQVAFDMYGKVHDYISGEPVNIDKASYVLGSGVETPMGYDIVAFMDRADAERFVADAGKGKVASYPEINELEFKN
jgi:copper chaperone NosL